MVMVGVALALGAACGVLGGGEALAGESEYQQAPVASTMEKEKTAGSLSGPVGMLIGQGDFSASARTRHEFVDQDDFEHDAHAPTTRLRTGVTSGRWRGIQAGVQGEAVIHLGADRFNSTDNGKLDRPVVADPEGVELNRAWLSFKPDASVELTYGRQDIKFDNQRFIGTVGWRQNDQSFDAVRLDLAPWKNVEMSYVFVHNVNRIFGDDAENGNLNGEIHLINASWQPSEQLGLTAYSYLLDSDDPVAESSATHGLRTQGVLPIRDRLSLTLTAEFAYQADHADNPANYKESYFLVLPGVSIGGNGPLAGLSLQGGYEQLGGDGTNAVQTPLATLHAHNGWADQFLNTPDSGLKDWQARLLYAPGDDMTLWLKATQFEAVWHDFRAEEGDQDFGQEVDLRISRSFGDLGPFENMTVGLKYADFDGEGAFVDVRKAWAWVGLTF